MALNWHLSKIQLLIYVFITQNIQIISVILYLRIIQRVLGRLDGFIRILTLMSINSASGSNQGCYSNIIFLNKSKTILLQLNVYQVWRDFLSSSPDQLRGDAFTLPSS